MRGVLQLLRGVSEDGSDPAFYATSLGNFAKFEHDCGNISKADELARKALAEIDQHHDQDPNIVRAQILAKNI